MPLRMLQQQLGNISSDARSAFILPMHDDSAGVPAVAHEGRIRDADRCAITADLSSTLVVSEQEIGAWVLPWQAAVRGALPVCAERSCMRRLGELTVRNQHCAGTNHIGHFVLAISLLEKMTAQAQVPHQPYTMLPQLQCVSIVTTVVCRVC